MSERFGFEAYYDGHSYNVHLPHHCDEWVITCKRDKEGAVKEFKRFIAEAQEALKKLESLK